MPDIFMNSAYSPMWAAFGMIMQGLATILAIAALLVSISTFRKNLQTSHYGEMDRMYFDLLSLRLNDANLRRTDIERSAPEERETYDVYAYMVWNFLEAIHDRCEDDTELCGTWDPVTKVENELHRQWFDRTENHDKFKPEFRRHIERTYIK